MFKSSFLNCSFPESNIEIVEVVDIVEAVTSTDIDVRSENVNVDAKNVDIENQIDEDEDEVVDHSGSGSGGSEDEDDEEEDSAGDDEEDDDDEEESAEIMKMLGEFASHVFLIFFFMRSIHTIFSNLFDYSSHAVFVIFNSAHVTLIAIFVVVFYFLWFLFQASAETLRHPPTLPKNQNHLEKATTLVTMMMKMAMRMTLQSLFPTICAR